MFIRKLFIYLFLILSPVFSLAADLTFTEIMYDAQGTDTGFEWVEIKNNSNHNISLKDYKFCEGGSSVVCHSLKEENNPSFNLEAGAFGIITDDRDKFKSKYNFSGLILVSTGFTLTNTGETIELKSKDGIILDSLNYNTASGGKDGDTLSIFNNVWKNGEATPGAKNIEKIRNDDDDDDTSNGGNNNEDKTNHSYVEISDMLAGKKKLKAEIDNIQTVMAGAQIEISGRAYGLTGVEIRGVEYLWSLGDGSKDKDQIIYHEYQFPGEYLISLVVKSGHFTSPKTTRKIIVIDPPIGISLVNFEKKFVEIENKSNKILNLQDWILMIDGEKFIIPKNTFISENGNIKFSNRNTNLRMKEGDRVFLLYPNGDKFREYSKIEESDNNYSGKEQAFVERKTEKDKSKGDKRTITITSQKNEEYNTSSRTKFKNSDKSIKIDVSDKPDLEKKNYGQEASLLSLKSTRNSFVRENIFEISFFGFLLLLIFILLFFKQNKTPDFGEGVDSFKLEED